MNFNVRSVPLCHPVNPVDDFCFVLFIKYELILMLMIRCICSALLIYLYFSNSKILCKPAIIKKALLPGNMSFPVKQVQQLL